MSSSHSALYTNEYPLTDSLSSGRFIEYALDRPDVQRVWEKFTYHEFVEGMGHGTLPLARFKEYLVQDYLYLVSFSLVLYIILTRQGS